MQKYPGAFTLLGISLSHYLLFPDFWDNLTFVRFGGYTIIIASSKLKPINKNVLDTKSPCNVVENNCLVSL